MPFLHRVWADRSHFSAPMSKSPLHDVYCGLRGFRKDVYCLLDSQRIGTGMEFATEMMIKASLYRAKIAEVPYPTLMAEKHPRSSSSDSPTAGERYAFFLSGYSRAGCGWMRRSI